MYLSSIFPAADLGHRRPEPGSFCSRPHRELCGEGRDEGISIPPSPIQGKPGRKGRALPRKVLRGLRRLMQWFLIRIGLAFRIWLDFIN